MGADESPINTDNDADDDDDDDDDDNDGIKDKDDPFPKNDFRGMEDSDGDGVPDDRDAFFGDEFEYQDSDGDGVGTNADFDDNDPTETTDLDNDGVGANADVDDNDHTETTDIDGDGVGDNRDNCDGEASERGWRSSSDTDYDDDGCKDDSDEDDDDDNDGVADAEDSCSRDATGSGANEDQDGDEVCSASDVDDDGDGLIEIYNAKDLENMRYNLTGTSLVTGDDLEVGELGNSLGCGDAKTVFACNGYELATHIVLEKPASDLSNWVPLGNSKAEPFSAILEGNGKIIYGLVIICIRGTPPSSFTSLAITVISIITYAIAIYIRCFSMIIIINISVGTDSIVI